MIALITAAALSWSVFTHHDDVWLTTSGRPQGYAIVQAKATSVTAGRVSDFDLSIEHVFGGEQSLLGADVVGKSYARGNAGVLTLHPTLQVGEIGIWLVPDARKGEALDAYTMNRMSQIVHIRLPARKLAGLADNNFDRALHWARAVEQLEPLDQEDRVQQLQDFAVEEDPTLSAWAIRVLATTGEHSEFFWTLSRGDSISLPGEIALDDVMSDRDSDRWLQSPERDKLQRKWLEQPLDDQDSMMLLTHLNAALYRGGISPHRFFEYLSAIISGPYLDQSKLRAINSLRAVLNDPEAKDDALALLAGILLGNESIELKLAAAASLRSLKKADPTQLALLRQIYQAYMAHAIDAEGEDVRHIESIATGLGELVRNLSDAKQPQP